MEKAIKNYGRSVKERLLNISRAERYSTQLLISRYFQERLLYRLSVSKYKDCFILKGGALLYAHDGFKARPSLDIDFMAKNISNDMAKIGLVFQEITFSSVADIPGFDWYGSLCQHPCLFFGDCHCREVSSDDFVIIGQ